MASLPYPRNLKHRRVWHPCHTHATSNIGGYGITAIPTHPLIHEGMTKRNLTRVTQKLIHCISNE